jgi:hypothetical protein
VSSSPRSPPAASAPLLVWSLGGFELELGMMGEWGDRGISSVLQAGWFLQLRCNGTVCVLVKSDTFLTE